VSVARDITVEVELPYPPADVWAALTDPVALADWLMPVEDFAPVVGQKFTVRARPMPGWDGVVHCEVTEVDEPNRLAYTWRGSKMREATSVAWTLSTVDSGTRLRLDHTGFSGILMAFMHRMGWRKMLRAKLTRHLTHG
jgi:uncharacterized protein YndB with AHSA1/START domain